MNLPEFHLRNQFVLTDDGRIIGTRSQEPWQGPLFRLIRGKETCAWAVRIDIPQSIADELDGLAREEPPVSDFGDAPVHAERYMSLLGGEVDSGPAFTFPEEIVQPAGTVFIEDIESLDHHFTGWTASEIPCRTPIVAYVEGGYAVSVCFTLMALRRSGGSRSGNGGSVSRARTRSASYRWVGTGGSSLRSRSALQHVLVQRRLNSGCPQAGAGDVRLPLEYP